MWQYIIKFKGKNALPKSIFVEFNDNGTATLGWFAEQEPYPLEKYILQRFSLVQVNNRRNIFTNSVMHIFSKTIKEIKFKDKYKHYHAADHENQAAYSLSINLDDTKEIKQAFYTGICLLVANMDENGIFSEIQDVQPEILQLRDKDWVKIDFDKFIDTCKNYEDKIPNDPASQQHIMINEDEIALGTEQQTDTSHKKPFSMFKWLINTWGNLPTWAKVGLGVIASFALATLIVGIIAATGGIGVLPILPALVSSALLTMNLAAYISATVATSIAATAILSTAIFAIGILSYFIGNKIINKSSSTKVKNPDEGNKLNSKLKGKHKVEEEDEAEEVKQNGNYKFKTLNSDTSKKQDRPSSNFAWTKPSTWFK